MTSQQAQSPSNPLGRRNSTAASSPARLSKQNLMINEILGTMVESQSLPPPPQEPPKEDDGAPFAAETPVPSKPPSVASKQLRPRRPSSLPAEAAVRNSQVLPLSKRSILSRELQLLSQKVPVAPPSPSRVSRISQRLRFRDRLSGSFGLRPSISEVLQKVRPQPPQILPGSATMPPQQQQRPTPSVLQNAMVAVMSAAPSSRERKSSNRSWLVSNPRERYSRLERVPRIIHQFVTQNWYYLRFILIGVAVVLGVFVLLPAFIAL